MSILFNIETSSRNNLRMKIIKLSATESTNSFLKELSVNSSIENFTVVVTKEQTSGRGQMNTTWFSDNGKNLTFSVFIKFKDLLISNQKFLNYAISISAYDTLLHFRMPDLAIKWPNDILSEKDKVIGILIENSLQRNKINSSIIGIGLNVNQEYFPSEIPNPSSLKLKTGKIYDLDEVLAVFLDNLKKNIDAVNNQEFDVLEEKYLSFLFKKDTPSMFKTDRNVFFMGKIIGVSNDGKLQIELTDETIQEFGLKEVSFA